MPYHDTFGRYGGFNSMIVRLKDTMKFVPPAVIERFNSMIVRLKAFCRRTISMSKPMFQFYDSPIKSIQKKRPGRRGGSFNSMIVRLKVRQKDTRFLYDI